MGFRSANVGSLMIFIAQAHLRANYIAWHCSSYFVIIKGWLPLITAVSAPLLCFLSLEIGCQLKHFSLI